MSGSRFLERGAQSPKVVLADEDDRQLVNRGKIQRLVKRSLIPGALAEETKDHRRLFFEAYSKSRADSNWNASADNPVCSEHAFGNIRNMHASTFAAAVSVRPTKDFRHHPSGIQAPRQRMPVTPVRTGQQIVFLHR